MATLIYSFRFCLFLINCENCLSRARKSPVPPPTTDRGILQLSPRRFILTILENCENIFEFLLNYRIIFRFKFFTTSDFIFRKPLPDR